ncbi:MAG: LysM peptidoglycan-binding domain-containing protein [Actinomycetes bacterium]
MAHRAVGGWVLGTGVVAGVAGGWRAGDWGAATLAGAGSGPGGLSAVVAGTAALVAAALTGWLVLGVLVAAVDEVRPAGRRAVPGVVVPALTRRVVAAVLGAGSACAALPAAADPPPPVGVAVAAVAAESVDVDPGWPASPEEGTLRGLDVDPGWAPAPPAPVVRTVAADLGPLTPAARGPAVTEDAVVVRRGDTLWHIAARALPAGATDAEIAAEWPRWYDANRALIGADPHHIEPGQRLVPPGVTS